MYWRLLIDQYEGDIEQLGERTRHLEETTRPTQSNTSRLNISG
jgi:hypothetical protein